MNQPRPRSPGEQVRYLLDGREWNQVELGAILGIPSSRVTEIIQNRKSIDPELAVKLSNAFLGTTPQEWLAIEAEYRLSKIDQPDDSIRKRALLLSMVPSREMEKRGWIGEITSVDDLEVELKRFFNVPNLDSAPTIPTAMRKSNATDDLTPAQRAWCFRVRNLASNLVVAKFSESRLAGCERELRKLAAFPQEARKVPDVLASYGIRFVIVEPIAKCKIDGAVMWIDEESPVIGMSLRFDRIDSFWFTLFHEFMHVKHKDAISVDTDLVGAEAFIADTCDIERRANTAASEALVANAQLESFIKRVSPLYSRERINQFANRVQIHPGIIVGQLQHRAEVGFHALKETQVKVRDIVVATAVTDGWGQVVG